MLRAVEQDVASDDTVIAAEDAPPESVGDVGCERCAGFIVRGRDEPAKQWIHAEHIQHPARDERRRRPRRLLFAGEIHSAIHPALDELPRLCLALQIEIFRDGEWKAPQAAIGEVWKFGVKADEPFRFRVRQRTQQEGVDHGEHRGRTSRERAR